MGCHSSANVEEAALVLEPLRGKVNEVTALPPSRPKVAPDGGFDNVAHVCRWINLYKPNGCINRSQ
jgi:hypothetical protein